MMETETIFFNKLKDEYESKKKILQQLISELVNKESAKDSCTIEKVEVATAEYNQAAKEYQGYIKSNVVKAQTATK